MKPQAKLIEVIDANYVKYNNILTSHINNEKTTGKADTKLRNFNLALLYSIMYNTEVVDLLRNNEVYSLTKINNNLCKEQVIKSFACNDINIVDFLLSKNDLELILNLSYMTYNQLAELITYYNKPFGNQGLNDILTQILARTGTSDTGGGVAQKQPVLNTVDDVTIITSPFELLSNDDRTIEIYRDGLLLTYDGNASTLSKYTLTTPNVVTLKAGVPPAMAGEVFLFIKR